MTLFQKDYANTVHWFSMCRDFNPKQAECSIALTRYYYLNGVHEKAIAELEKLLKNGHEERVMLNILNTKECAIPQAAIELLTLKGRNGLLSVADAKYLVLLVSCVQAMVAGLSFMKMIKI